MGCNATPALCQRTIMNFKIDLLRDGYPLSLNIHVGLSLEPSKLRNKITPSNKSPRPSKVCEDGADAFFRI